MAQPGHREHAASDAFDRAVEREREAIRHHEAAARQQDTIAAQLEQHALNDRNDVLCDEALDHAARARQRAGLARGRAVRARARLTEEGVDPDHDEHTTAGASERSCVAPPEAGRPLT